MTSQAPVVFHSNNKRQKQSVIKAITHIINDDYIREHIGWSWDRLAVEGVTDSDFDNVHRPGAACLARLVRHPDFIKIRQEHSIPQTAVFHVDEKAHLIYVHENFSSRRSESGNVTVACFSDPVNITEHLVGLVAFDEDLRLLANMTKLTGGVIRSGKLISIGQWLRFHGLPLPATEESAKELMDLLNFTTLPESPAHGNYWQLLDSPQGSPFELTKENRAVIRQVTALETGAEIPLVSLYGDSLKLEAGSADTLPTSQAYRMTRLIDIAVSLADNGQAYLDALGWFTDEASLPPTQSFIEQLLIAVMLLDLDPDLDSANTSFAGFDFYSKRHLLLSPSQVREQLESHLASQFKLDGLIAPLVAEWVLAGMAPEYLVRDLPPALRLATPGWVVFTQAVHFVESIAPGVSRNMTYEHVLGFGRLSELSPALQTQFAEYAVDPVITWALMNRLIARDAEGNLSQDAVSLAFDEHKRYIDLVTKAVSALGTPLPHRKELALAHLKSEVPGCDPEELLVKHRGTGGGGKSKVSVIDLYLGDELHTQDWDRIRGGSFYQSFPDLIDLVPAAELYELAINRQYETMESALSDSIQIAFSQLRPLDRQFIEEGELTVYGVRAFLESFDATGRRHNFWAGNTGRYGPSFVQRLMHSFAAMSFSPCAWNAGSTRHSLII